MARTLRGYIADLRDPLTVPACERQGEPAPGGLASVAPISLGHGGESGRHPIGVYCYPFHPFKAPRRAAHQLSHPWVISAPPPLIPPSLPPPTIPPPPPSPLHP